MGHLFHPQDGGSKLVLFTKLQGNAAQKNATLQIKDSHLRAR